MNDEEYEDLYHQLQNALNDFLTEENLESKLYAKLLFSEEYEKDNHQVIFYSTETIFDPACGSAGILVKGYEYLKDNFSVQDGQQIRPKLFDAKVVQLCLMNLLLQNNDSAKLKCCDALCEEIITNNEFKYDIVTTHLPFIKEDISNINIWKKHITKSLSKKGKAVILISSKLRNIENITGEVLSLNKNIEGDLIEKVNVINNNITTSIASINFTQREEKAYVCKLLELNSLREYKESTNVGVYFLTSPEQDKSIKMYIGESENIYRRLLQHKRESKYDFWINTYFVLSKTNILDKGNIRYLEYKFMELGQKSNNIIIVNTRGYSKIPNLKPSDQENTETFFNDCKDLLAELGLKFE